MKSGLRLKFIFKNLPLLLILLFVSFLYYKFFILGKIPFPGDLLVNSYSPWIDYNHTPVQNPEISDVFSQIYIWKNMGMEMFKKGEFPLWNPYSFTGNPLLANYQSSLFYPLNILLLLPKDLGWGLFIFSQTFLAALNMYLLLSLWINSKAARFIGTLIFSLGGLMTTWLELGTGVHSIIWLPLSFFSIDSFIKKAQIRYLLLLLFSLVCSALAGSAQVATYSFILILAFIIFRNFESIKKGSFGKSLPLILTTLSSVLISAPQLLPSYELLQNSIRTSDAYISVNNFGLLSIGDLFKFFVADFFGNAATRNYWGFLNYTETSGFIGSLSLPLFIYGLLKLRGDRLVLFFTVTLSITGLLIFNNPLSEYIYRQHIPILTSSYASRLLFITTFFIAIIAAFISDHLYNNPHSLPALKKAIIYSLSAFIGAISGLLISYLMVKRLLNNPPQNIFSQFYSTEGYNLDYYITSLRNTILPFLLILSLGIFIKIIDVIQRFKIIPVRADRLRLIILFIAFLYLFDLSRYFFKITPFVSQNMIFPKTPSLEYLQKQPGFFRVGRENAEVLPPNTWAAYNLQSFEGYDPLYLKSYSRFINFVNNGVLETGGFGRYAELTQKKYNSPFIDLLNTKYFIAILRDKNGYLLKKDVTNPEDYLNYLFKEKGSKLKIVFQDKSSVILENPNVGPRAYFAKNLIYAQTPQDEQRIFNSSFNSKQNTVISEVLDINSVSGKGEVKIIDYKPNIVELTTKTENDEVLILADQYENGWKAKVDNNNIKIVRADLIFRAIKIPAGAHKVQFYYWPKSFEIGLYLSFGTILTLLFTLLVYKKWTK